MRAATTARARANGSPRRGVASTSRRSRGKTARRSASERESVDVRDIKRRLRAACARASGRASTRDAREDALELVRALESVNGGATVDASRVSGRWSLLATLATSEDARARREKEGAIGAALTDASGSAGRSVDGEEEERARSIVTPKGNFQDIDLDARTAANRAEFELFGRPLSVTLDAECGFNDSVAHPTRLNVRFRAVEVKFASWPPLRLSLDFASPEGWIETTYVDDDLRTGRGDKGSIFIAARRPDDN